MTRLFLGKIVVRIFICVLVKEKRKKKDFLRGEITVKIERKFFTFVITIPHWIDEIILPKRFPRR